MEKLRISDDRRYFIQADGSPFVWLADTVWTMPQRMRWDDAAHFMRERKKQGFTVLQICALDPERDEGMHDPAGNPALIDGDLNKPNEEYFRYLDRILDTAESYGFYVLLLPVWGQLVVGDDWSGNTFEKTVTQENAYAYGCYIGNRYKNRSNILWCLGGDRQPIHINIDYRGVWRLMAEGLAKGVTGKDLHWDQPDPSWEEVCITYHTNYEMETGACSTMCYWTDEEAWISFIMLQTGHSEGTRSWAWVEREYDREHAAKKFTYQKDYQMTWNVPVEKNMRRMPVWDGEPYYERGLSNCSLIRHRAYWNMLAGSFGFTYGNWAVWSSTYQKDTRQGLMADTWYDALSSVGSSQMKHLRAFMEGSGILTAEPCQAILGQDADGGARPEEETALFTTRNDMPLNHRQAAVSADKSQIYIYFPHAGSIVLDLTSESVIEYIRPFFNAHTPQEDMNVFLWWYNPRTGVFADGPQTARVIDGKLPVKMPAGNIREATPNPLDTDWVLMIRNKETGIPFTEAGSYWSPDGSDGDPGKEKTVFF